jgi:uncharacterized protein (DUF4415 family)
MTMPSVAEVHDRRPRGRPLRARTKEVVLLKAKRTITVPQEIDERILERAQQEGGSYSGLVEDAIRAYLGEPVSAQGVGCDGC